MSRHKRKSIKVNFIMNAFLTCSNFIFPLITFPYVSRVLLADGNGKINFHHQHGGHGFVVGRFACDDRNCTEIPRIQRIAAGSV